MKPNVFYLKETDLSEFLGLLRQGVIFGTVNNDERSTYDIIPAGQVNRVVLAVAPPVESIKGFLFPAREKVAVYPTTTKAKKPASEKIEEVKKTVIGARACDLYALEVLDKIFMEQGVTDPFYQKRRNNTIIVTTDCVEACESCFCHLVDGKPYPEKGFDVNFSPITGGYLITCVREKGHELIDETQNLLTPATKEQKAERDRRRKEVLENLKEQNRQFWSKKRAPQIEFDRTAQKWTRLSSACVECGACNFICPTCHCFFLYDQPFKKSPKQAERQKSWDSCLLSNYAKMAGAGGMKPTPRAELQSRFENRVRHKFEWMPENIRLWGCVGCGRCIEGCPGGLDVRDVFKEFGQ